MKDLTDRIDIALSKVGKTRADLAAFLNISPQAMSKLRGSASATMKADRVAEAAKFMRCDIYWLCTGKGGRYVPDRDSDSELNLLARAVVRLVLSMPEQEQFQAFTILSLMASGQWQWSDPRGGTAGLVPKEGFSVDSSAQAQANGTRPHKTNGRSTHPR